MTGLRSRTAFIVLALALTFAGLGARGLWDPDEGRYTNVALHMLESGDWIHPMRSDEVGHWTKPPLTYWAIAASVGVLGYHPSAARLPGALAFLACIWLTFRIARRLAPGDEWRAALVYATMALPLVAAHWISTDYLLSATIALAMLGFVEARWGPPGRRQRGWIGVMWLGFGLGFLTKGPPALLPLAAVILQQWLAPRDGLSFCRLFWLPALGGFFLLAFSWYFLVTREAPALLSYFLGREVIDRVAGAGLNRNPEWYGWIKVYVPVLIVGTLPWTACWLWSLRRLPAQIAAWRVAPGQRREDAAVLFLWSWLLLPLAVFCLARSRMPLYLLPLFPALAILAAREWSSRAAGRPFPWRRLGAWVVLVLVLRMAWAWWPTPKDASLWADAIRARVDGPVTEVVFIEHPPHYGLHLHLGATVERVSLDPGAGRGSLSIYDTDLAAELGEGEPAIVLVTRLGRWPEVAARLAELGYVGVRLGEPFMDRVILEVEPAPR